MKRKKTGKLYWEMNLEELRQATKEFDEEFVATRAKKLTPAMKVRWKRARAKRSHVEDGLEGKVVAVRLEKDLLERCTALARKKRISRDALITRGLKALLAAEGMC